MSKHNHKLCVAAKKSISCYEPCAKHHAYLNRSPLPITKTQVWKLETSNTNISFQFWLWATRNKYFTKLCKYMVAVLSNICVCIYYLNHLFSVNVICCVLLILLIVICINLDLNVFFGSSSQLRVPHLFISTDSAVQQFSESFFEMTFNKWRRNLWCMKQLGVFNVTGLPSIMDLFMTGGFFCAFFSIFNLRLTVQCLMLMSNNFEHQL